LDNPGMPWKDRITQHLNWFLDHAPCHRHGDWKGRCWLSSLDLKTGAYPEYEHPEEIGARCYRWIESPHGSNLYWDLPTAQFVHTAGLAWAHPDWCRAVEEAVVDYWERAEAPSHLLYWGNHYYLEAATGDVLMFTGSKPPAVFDHDADDGNYHELRPIALDWGFLHALKPDKTPKFAEVAARRHLVDPATGLFNRHAGHHGKPHAFLEAGALNAEVAAWCAAHGGPADLQEAARRMLHYSWSHRDPATGLIPVEPAQNRWDKTTATTETGFWVSRVLVLSRWMEDGEIWRKRAVEALHDWLTAALDRDYMRYHGRLHFQTGKPTDFPKDTLYQPDDFTDFWHPLFPRHDYPLQTAWATLQCAQFEGGAVWEGHLSDMVEAVGRSLSELDSRPLYAEMAGRALIFLHESRDLVPAAVGYRDELLARVESGLWAGERFRSHTGEDRVDAVDGMGFLFAALVSLEGETLPDGLRLLF